MTLPPGLNKERAAKKKLGQIPTGKKTSKRTGIVRAMIDTRGERNWNLGCPTLKAVLPAGDVMCTCSDGATVLIERKTPDDFLNSISDTRLFSQVARMVKRTPWNYVVVTGFFYPERGGNVQVKKRVTGWKWAALQGALVTIQEMGTAVVNCKEGDFEQTVIRLCNRKHGVKPIQPARETALLSEGEQAIAALPGIGHERVQALTEKLGGFVNILSWLTDLTNKVKVPGVADGTKKRVKKALNLDRQWCITAVPENVGPYYLPDHSGAFIATTPEGYDWICELWKEREHGD